MTEELDMRQVRKAARKTLIDGVNDGIRYANNHRNRQVGLLTKLVSMKSINRAVAIARNPGPGMKVKKGQFDTMLELAGFDPNKGKHLRIR